MELNIIIEKFGPQNKEIVEQIKKWNAGSKFDEEIKNHFNYSSYKRSSAFAYIYEKEVVAYALVEQMKDDETGEIQCNLGVFINPDARHSGLEDYVVSSIINNKNKMLSKNGAAPSLFVGIAEKDDKALVAAYLRNGFEKSEQYKNSTILIKHSEPQKERE